MCKGAKVKNFVETENLVENYVERNVIALIVSQSTISPRKIYFWKFVNTAYAEYSTRFYSILLALLWKTPYSTEIRIPANVRNKISGEYVVRHVRRALRSRRKHRPCIP